jgi:hypothetical protein
MFKTGSAMIDAEHAFTRARRDSRLSRLRGTRTPLPVFASPLAGARRGDIREIPLDAISGTLEPSRAAQFDERFRPVRTSARRRWERVWIAQERGVTLPPISVMPIGDRFAVRRRAPPRLRRPRPRRGGDRRGGGLTL